MSLLYKIFNRNRFTLSIKIPRGIEIVRLQDKVRFRGNQYDITKFAMEFYRLDKLHHGALCKLDRYTLKVSDYITEDRYKENWIELPRFAWGVIGSKFREAAGGETDNPFDFNSCGCTDANPFDIGVEVTDLPIGSTRED